MITGQVTDTMSKNNKVKPPITRLQPDPETGLSSAAVEERIRKGYRNIAADPNDKTTLKIIAGNLFTFFNIVLLSIAMILIILMISLSASGHADIVAEYFGFTKFIFLIPAVMNVGMGSFQEIKSLQVIKKLRIVTGTKAKVVRGGEIVTIEAADIVPDDIVALSAGDQASADLIVLTGEVEVDESILTGESDLVKKRPGDTVLSGSSVIVGSARCRADRIGDDTYAAELTRKVKSGARHKSELMTSVMKIIKVLTLGLLIAVTVITATLIYKFSVHGSDTAIWDGLNLSLNDPLSWVMILLTDSMFGIGIIPSGLVLTTSVAMMVSIAQLTKKQTLVQELYSLENLSRVDVICLDKTGTLTDGTMAVCDVKAFIPMDDVRRHARMLIAASGEERNATAEAVYQYFGAEDEPDYQEAIPFSSANKYSGLVYHDGRKLLMGAPDYLVDPGDERMSYVAERAGLGNRVIALKLDDELIAFIAIEDHIRDTAADTLRFFRENGVTVKVISGDSPLTVSIIAQKCGIVNADKSISLAGVALEDIPAIAGEYTVFARVSPEQKEALVAALQSQGHKVAMTGDGVNDILALRRSDSSITFAKATEAAKSCSDVILLDNDFSHLREVVGEGRRVIGNIRKTAVLYLMKSVFVFCLAFALIPFAKGQMWFSIENLYMLEAAVIGTGGFLLSLEPRRTPVQGSFMKYIVGQSVAAGILALFATLLPIMLYTVPTHYGAEPFVTYENVRAMITVLMTFTGLVVVLSMCVPFNKYRTLCILAVVGVTVVLGLVFPSSYIGGRASGFDQQFLNEVFRPLNSPAVNALVSDPNNFIVLQIFLYAAIPAFILVHFAAENYARKDFKDVRKNRAFRAGRRMMLSAGFVLILHGILCVVELILLVRDAQDLAAEEGLAFKSNWQWYIALLFGYYVLHFVIGVIGYMVWKEPTRRRIIIGFISGIVLLLLALIPIILTGTVISNEDLLDLSGSIISLAIIVIYTAGSVIVLINRRCAIPAPRKKMQQS